MARCSVQMLAAAVCLVILAGPAHAQSDSFIEATITDLGDPDVLVREFKVQTTLADQAQKRCDYTAWLAARIRILQIIQQTIVQETRAIAILPQFADESDDDAFRKNRTGRRAAFRLRLALYLQRVAQQELARWSSRQFIPCERSPRRAQLPGSTPASAPADRRVGQAILVPLPQEPGVFKNSSFEVGGSFAFVTLPQQGYLGSFNPETGQETVGSFQTNRDLTMGGGSFNFEQGLSGGGPPGSGFSFFVYGAVQAMEGSNSGGGSFDPGPGNRTLFPGPEGGLSGVSLGGHPLNVVTDINYRAEYSAAGGLGGFGFRFFASPNVRVSIGGHAGYQNIEAQQNFAGAILGFGRTFSYETSTSADNFTFGFKSGIEWQAFPNVVLSMKGHAGAAKLNGSGTDTFVFTGLPIGTTGLDANKTQFVGGASAGIQVTLTPLSNFTTVRAAPPTSSVVVIGGEVGFERAAGYPTIFRDGTNRSQLQFNVVDVLRAKASIAIAY